MKNTKKTKTTSKVDYKKRYESLVKDFDKVNKELKRLREKMKTIYEAKQLVEAETFDEAWENDILKVYILGIGYDCFKYRTLIHRHPRIKIPESIKGKLEINGENFNRFKEFGTIMIKKPLKIELRDKYDEANARKAELRGVLNNFIVLNNLIED